jgi:hypothetical protein
LNNIESFEVLERRNPLFEGITTGAVATARSISSLIRSWTRRPAEESNRGPS